MNRRSLQRPALVFVLTAAVASAAVGCATPRASSKARPPRLPAGARTHWEIEGPHEIIAAVLSPPEIVADRLPTGLRFITVAEFAAAVPDAPHREHLRTYPEHAAWVVSFFEIVRQEKFVIDDRQPRWPQNGAAGVWMIPVMSSPPEAFQEDGMHVLEVWISDAPYAVYMSDKGHHAIYGDATLVAAADDRWTGTLEAEGLRARATCALHGKIRPQGSGTQLFFAPGRDATVVLRASVAGHQQSDCTGSWSLSGSHPLGRSITIGRPWFEFGYSLIGGVYDWPPRPRK